MKAARVKLLVLVLSLCTISTSGCYWAADKLGLAIGYPYRLELAAQDLNDPKVPEEGIRNQNALTDTLDGCGRAMDYYEIGNTGVGILGFMVAIGGAVAGGVVVPMLTAAANANRAQIAAWGGVSGVANTAQVGLGQSARQSQQKRESIRSGFAKAMTAYADAGPDSGLQRAAILQAIVACRGPQEIIPTTGASKRCIGSVAVAAAEATVSADCNPDSHVSCTETLPGGASPITVGCTFKDGVLTITGATAGGVVNYSQVQSAGS